MHASGGNVVRTVSPFVLQKAPPQGEVSWGWVCREKNFTRVKNAIWLVAIYSETESVADQLVRIMVWNISAAVSGWRQISEHSKIGETSSTVLVGWWESKASTRWEKPMTIGWCCPLHLGVAEATKIMPILTFDEQKLLHHQRLEDLEFPAPFKIDFLTCRLGVCADNGCVKL